MKKDEKEPKKEEGATEVVAKTAQSGESSKKIGGDYFADFDFEKLTVDVRAMLKSGVHFGHQKARKNPKMSDYIFGVKNGVNIIDLGKTAESLREAISFVEKIVAEGQDVLFVGTKKQAKGLVESAARRCEMPFVVDRWLGGTFTNFKVISSRTRFLRDGQDKMEKGEYGKYTKFERMKMSSELEDLENKMGGIKNMTKFPGAIFTTGVIEDNLAIQEAQKKNIPIISLVDTNVDPGAVDYPIPSNDDAISSLKLMIGYICKAVLDGKDKRNNAKTEEK